MATCARLEALDPTVAQILAASAVLFVGATVQGSVGFGANLVAVPLLVLINPAFVPGPVIITATALNLLVIRREPAGHAWREVRWPVVGQVPGAALGAYVLAHIPTDGLKVFFAVLILVAVALSLSGLRPRRTPRTLVAAGGAASFMGTTVGIGGPPMALLYQRSTGPEIRAALSRFFLVNIALSLTMLTIFGELELHDVRVAAFLLPASIAGFLLSSRLLHHVDPSKVRASVLTLSAFAAVAAILQTIR